jgi:hypothetical protein
VTLSYGLFENKMNSVELNRLFSKEDDPSRSVPLCPQDKKPSPRRMIPPGQYHSVPRIRNLLQGG